MTSNKNGLIKIYLAGRMEHYHGNVHLADWRSEIMARATTKRQWMYPEQIEEEVDEKHGYSLTDIPGECLKLVAASDFVLFYIDSPDRMGTFCEMAVASHLGIHGYCAVLDPNFVDENDYELTVVPWFVSSMYICCPFKTEEECLTYLISCIGGEKVDYHTYIQSSEWREKAKAAKDLAGWRCQVCNKPDNETTLDAHHRTYERLGKELPTDITVLCRQCHGKFHGKA